MDFWTRLAVILKKPLHYLLVGIVLIAWSLMIEKNTHSINLLIGCIFVVIALASFIEWLCTKANNLIKQREFKDQVIKIYNEAQACEKVILSHCIENNILTYTTDAFQTNYINAIKSLSLKGMGSAVNHSYAFALHNNVLEILKSYTKKNNKK